MAKQFAEITEQHRKLNSRQKIFFVASAAQGLCVNVSPRSTDCLRYLSGNTIAYLDRTGSGNETAAHVRAGGRVTITFCSLEGPPLILRLYGKAINQRDSSDEYRQILKEHYNGRAPLGARQIVSFADLIQTSCGYSVPLFSYSGERDVLDKWSISKGEEVLRPYRREHNERSIDGLSTGLLEDEVILREPAS